MDTIIKRVNLKKDASISMRQEKVVGIGTRYHIEAKINDEERTVYTGDSASATTIMTILIALGSNSLFDLFQNMDEALAKIESLR